jgi:PIN domain nuclease of toxin-antitoxin system
MRLLVDTHALIWALAEVERLSPRAREVMSDGRNTLLVSAVSGYEIEFKRIRDPLLQRLPPQLEAVVARSGFEWMALTPADAIEAGRLPAHHGDACDRLLIAQALKEGLPVVTLDRWFPAYGVQTIW